MRVSAIFIEVFGWLLGVTGIGCYFLIYWFLGKGVDSFYFIKLEGLECERLRRCLLGSSARSRF